MLPRRPPKKPPIKTPFPNFTAYAGLMFFIDFIVKSSLVKCFFESKTCFVWEGNAGELDSQLFLSVLVIF